MVRFLQLLSVVVLLAAGSVFFMLCVSLWSRDDAKISAVLTAPSAVEETFMEDRNRHPDNTGEIASPLLVQAQIFASYLNSAQPAKQIASPTPAIRPPAPTMRFKLHGTSYYPNQPDRSIALIWEPGSPEEKQRWVKEGERLGRFIIHEIRRGVVVYRDENEQLHEMSIERKATTRSLVRDHISSLTMAQVELGQRSTPGSQPDSNSLTE